jgi:hypothetical protein
MLSIRFTPWGRSNEPTGGHVTTIRLAVAAAAAAVAGAAAGVAVVADAAEAGASEGVATAGEADVAAAGAAGAAECQPIVVITADAAGAVCGRGGRGRSRRGVCNQGALHKQASPVGGMQGKCGEGLFGRYFARFRRQDRGRPWRRRVLDGVLDAQAVQAASARVHAARRLPLSTLGGQSPAAIGQEECARSVRRACNACSWSGSATTQQGWPVLVSLTAD